MNKRVKTSQVDGFDVHFHANGIELNSMHLPACTAPWTPLESLQFVDQMMHFPVGESTNPPSCLGTYRWYVVFLNIFLMAGNNSKAMRKDLQKILVDSLPSSCIKLGHKLVEITEGTDEVTLEFENGERATAHLLVASDGIHSFARQIFGGDQPEFTGFRVLYSLSSKHFRADPTVAHVHWKEVDGAGYGLLDLTAGPGPKRLVLSC